MSEPSSPRSSRSPLLRWLIVAGVWALVVVGSGSVARAAAPEWKFARAGGVVELEGEWEFVPDAFVETMEHGLPSSRVQVPSSWEDQPVPASRPSRELRAGTYALRLRIAPDVAAEKSALAIAFPYQMHAARLVVSTAAGRWAEESGHPALEPKDEVPLHRPVRVDFPAAETVDVFVHVSSHAERERAGMRRALTFGPRDAVEHARRMFEWRELFFIGVLFLAALYHAALAILRPRERAPLWFSLLAATMAVRTIVFATFLELTNPPSIGWHVSQQLVYSTTSAAVLLTLRYLEALFPGTLPRLALRTSDALGGALTLVPWLVGEPSFLAVSRAAQRYALVAIVLGLGCLVRHALRSRDRLAAGTLAGFALLAAATVRDILAVRVGSTSVYYAPYGLLGFMVVQVLVVATQNERARRHTEELLGAISNFVPTGFLELLGRADVSQVGLGDAVERRMTVLFADVRGFTTLSEHLGPEAIFGMLNGWFGRIGPHVPAHHGFIDKYIGDAIMALFPRTPSDAVRAAIAMQKEVATVFVSLPSVSRMPTSGASSVDFASARPLAIGIGIHHGTTMLGTIGERGRYEATVISDAVNIAARLEQATVAIGVKILVSGEVAEGLDADLRAALRSLGAFQVRGRRRPIELFEVVAGDSAELRDQKLVTRDRFEAARRRLIEGSVDAAREGFDALAREVPADRVVAFFLAVLAGEVAYVERGVVVLLEKSARSRPSNGGGAGRAS